MTIHLGLNSDSDFAGGVYSPRPHWNKTVDTESVTCKRCIRGRVFRVRTATSRLDAIFGAF